MGMKKLNLKNNVRKYRVWKGWKQSDLANISGMSLPQIRLIEQQKCTPQMRNREKLCKVFNLSYNQLFFENETAETLGGFYGEGLNSQKSSPTQSIGGLIANKVTKLDDDGVLKEEYVDITGDISITSAISLKVGDKLVVDGIVMVVKSINFRG